MTRLAILGLMLCTAPLAAQSLELAPVQARGNVGDILTIKVTARLHPGQELLELVPHPLLSVPEGMRIVSTDTLRKDGPDTWQGQIRMAFYRVGKQPVPTLGLLYRVEAGALPDTLVQAPLSIEIVPLLPAGNPSLKDIKPLERLSGPAWLPISALIVALLLATLWLFRRRQGVAPLWARKSAGVLSRTPFATALARLEALERDVGEAPAEVAGSFAEVAEIIRGVLLEVGALPHPGLTTVEVWRTLPIELADEGCADRCADLLRDADLVKFARLHPDRDSARHQIERARRLLQDWDRRVAPMDAAA